MTLLNYRQQAEEAYDQREDLMRWLAGPDGRGYFEYFATSKKDFYASGRYTSEEWREMGGNANAIRQCLELSEVYSVGPDPFIMIQHAAESRELEPWRAEDLPSQAGFVWLPGPLPMADARGIVCHVRALSWYLATLPQEFKSPNVITNDYKRTRWVNQSTSCHQNPSQKKQQESHLSVRPR
ncbi:MAG: hypothetical protein KGL39_37800 [Patescibacteria group bacterium]|nr:hypothetical protein [Patescibacteria group bacterium]